MIILKLQGGLGNQMFQYATARAIKRSNEGIYFDLTFLKEHHKKDVCFVKRDFSLDLFPAIKNKVLSGSLLRVLNGSSNTSKRLKRIKLLKQNTVFQAGGDHRVINVIPRKTVTYLDGYFQSHNYFESKRKHILTDFRFPQLDDKNEKIKDEINSIDNSLSIHIRRGDYVSNSETTKYHGLLPLTYYENAFSTLYNKHKNLVVYVFTDDIDWAKQNFLIKNVELNFISGNNGYDSWKDMALMSFCKHHVIANSSFSWWGAWLSEKDGETVAPKHWFAPHVNYNIEDIIPNHWIVLE